MVRVLVVVFVVSCLVCPSYSTSWAECNAPRGHGFVLMSAQNCSRFLGFHLAEFQCYHNHIVAAEFTFASSAQQTQFCALQTQNTNFFFTIAPTFILPDFAEGRIETSFTTDVFSGFFGSTLLQNISLFHRHTWYWEPLGNAQLNYLHPSRGGVNYVFVPEPFNVLFHRVQVQSPPDFDSVLMVRINATFVVPQKKRLYAFLVDFPDIPNVYEKKLLPNGSYSGTIGPFVVPGKNATSYFTKVGFDVLSEVYPGPTKANGDGRDDFKAYCPDLDRPIWDVCS